MIHKKIDKLIPYLSENFLTYPLWEEGNYIPFVNFWRICKTQEETQNLLKEFEELQNQIGEKENIQNVDSTDIAQQN